MGTGPRWIVLNSPINNGDLLLSDWLKQIRPLISGKENWTSIDESALGPLAPVALYKKALSELSRLHEKGFEHGNVRLSNFYLDKQSGQLQVVNFEYCCDFQSDGVYYKPFRWPPRMERRELFNEIRHHFTEEELSRFPFQLEDLFGDWDLTRKTETRII